MIKHQDGLNFSKLFNLNYSNINTMPNNPGLYMICKRNSSGANQVVFAGIAANLKNELLNYLEKNILKENLSFCYVNTSLDSMSRHLYKQAA